MSTVSGRIYRPEIDGLRAIAVLAVVFFHAEIPGFEGGFVGVDIFFVISGYLITRNILTDLAAEQFSIRSFYVSRLKRLFPAFLFVLLFTFLLGFFVLSPIHFLELGKTTVNAVLSLSNIFFWQDADYFATDSQYIPLLHTWSLSVEEQFYAIWPLFLVICVGFMSRFALAWVLFAIGCASLILAVWVAQVDLAAGFYLMPFRMFEFCIGAACIWIENKRKGASLEGEVAALAGYGAIAASIVLFTVKTPFPSYYALLPCVGTALLIIYGGTARSGAILRLQVAVGVGLISYSLYLFHWPLLVYGRYVKFGPLSPIETAGTILLSIVLAFLCFRFIEQSFRRFKFASIQMAPQSFVVGSLCVALLTVFLGAHAWGSKGWKFRIDRDSRRIMSLAAIDVYSPCREPGAQLRQHGFRCMFGLTRNSQDIDVVLLGDSHAEHWLPGLDQILKEASLRGIYAGDGGSLPFVIGRSMTANGPAPFTYTKPFEYVRQHKPKLVILSGRWAASAHATRPDGAALWYSLKNPSDSSAKASQEAIKAAARKTMDHLSEAATAVMILGQVPLVGLDLIACLSRPRIIQVLHQNPNCQGFSAKQVKARDKVMRVFLTGLVKDYQNAEYVDFVSSMCRSDYCEKKIGKSVLYRDDDHLSFQGSTALLQQSIAEKTLELLRTKN